MYIRQALDLMEGLMLTSEDNKEITAPHLQKLIVFSIMWSLGAMLELEDRKKVCLSLLNSMLADIVLNKLQLQSIL